MSPKPPSTTAWLLQNRKTPSSSLSAAGAARARRRPTTAPIPPTSLTITGKKDLAGRWLTVKTELVPKAKGAKTIATSEVWGYSRAAGTLVRNGASSEGGFIASTSAGWTGERFAWAGTSAQSGKNAKEKFAVEKKSDKEIAVELSLGVEELRVVFDGTCKR
jgi:hypothetical protein